MAFRRRLGENDLKPLRKDMWCIPQVDAQYVARMEEAPARVPLVPKHASWLNVVEIEIGLLRSQCLDRRIAGRERLVSESAAWERARNVSGARIKWMFTAKKARAKMGRVQPQPASTREPRSK